MNMNPQNCRKIIIDKINEYLIQLHDLYIILPELFPYRLYHYGGDFGSYVKLRHNSHGEIVVYDDQEPMDLENCSYSLLCKTHKKVCKSISRLTSKCIKYQKKYKKAAFGIMKQQDVVTKPFLISPRRFPSLDVVIMYGVAISFFILMLFTYWNRIG